jgi:hypothetical protein
MVVFITVIMHMANGDSFTVPNRKHGKRAVLRMGWWRISHEMDDD